MRAISGPASRRRRGACARVVQVGLKAHGVRGWWYWDSRLVRDSNDRRSMVRGGDPGDDGTRLPYHVV